MNSLRETVGQMQKLRVVRKTFWWLPVWNNTLYEKGCHCEFSGSGLHCTHWVRSRDVVLHAPFSVTLPYWTARGWYTRPWWI